jgi:deoxyribodipyrimidine photolyase
MPKTRVELFFKSPQDLRERIKFLHSHGIQAFNLVNKNRADTMVEWVDCIREEIPDADICAHYSLKYNKVARKGVKEHSTLLQEFTKSCRADEILIISGSGNKTGWNTVEALKHLSGTKAAVAYNPFFPSDQDQSAETIRLEEKLTTQAVSKVYLQFGTDLHKLKNALDMLGEKKVDVSGSMFLPTAKLIAQQKFRPWNGVFLSSDFLKGPDQATEIVVQMIRLYQKYNVEILWEAPGIRTDKDMALVKKLMDLSSRGSGQELDVNGENVVQHDTAREKVDEEDKSGDAMVQAIPAKRQKMERSEEPCILLFGSHDVRVGDNRALELATRNHKVVIPVFLWVVQGEWGVRGAQEVVLKNALRNLEETLKKHSLALVCRNCQTDGLAELSKLVQETGAKAVSWNKEHTTESRKVEKQRRELLEKMGKDVYETQSSLLYDPDTIVLSSGFNGGHWGTLMPFLKNCKKNHGEPPRPTPAHETFRLLEEAVGPTKWPASVSVSDLNMAVITGKQRWDQPICNRFPMSEATARENLNVFFSKGVKLYEKERSRTDKEYATSKLSVHLRIGTISPYELYWNTEDCGLGYDELKTFSRRLFWRDLAYYQLACFPQMRTKSIREHYENTDWVTGQEEKRRLEAWKWGKTGYPIVDAGMRELYATGWMTQSVRMVVASFLVEYLRVNWVKGCEWFHYTLVDADSAINAMMWQNAGKSGIDQWNFVPSPVTASQDPTGAYTRKWVPELVALPTTALIHRPWLAPEEVLDQAGVILGETYPHRIVVDLKSEREISVQSTLDMRRRSQYANSDRGYDHITLPDGKRTVVFTKKEYRIDSTGEAITESSGRSKKQPVKDRSRRGRRGR